MIKLNKVKKISNWVKYICGFFSALHTMPIESEDIAPPVVLEATGTIQAAPTKNGNWVVQEYSRALGEYWYSMYLMLDGFGKEPYTSLDYGPPAPKFPSQEMAEEA